MSLSARRTPERNSPLFSSMVLSKAPGNTITTQVLTTGGGAYTLTVAEALAGFVPVDCQDAQTLKVPTAADLNAGIPGVLVGNWFEIQVVNYGDTTLTLSVNTGVTTPTIATVAAVLSVLTLAAKRMRLVCTGVLANGDAADAWVLYAYGSTAAAVA